MVVCQGKSVLKGIAIGKIYLYEKQEYVLEQKQVADAEAEVARFEAAKETASDSWMTYMKKHLQKQAKSRR